MSAPTPSGQEPPPQPRGGYLFALSLGALGVVYGDIGTSPLYALRECFHGAHAVAPDPASGRTGTPSVPKSSTRSRPS